MVLYRSDTAIVSSLLSRNLCTVGLVIYDDAALRIVVHKTQSSKPIYLCDTQRKIEKRYTIVQ